MNNLILHLCLSNLASINYPVYYRKYSGYGQGTGIRAWVQRPAQPLNSLCLCAGCLTSIFSSLKGVDIGADLSYKGDRNKRNNVCDALRIVLSTELDTCVCLVFIVLDTEHNHLNPLQRKGKPVTSNNP